MSDEAPAGRRRGGEMQTDAKNDNHFPLLTCDA